MEWRSLQGHVHDFVRGGANVCNVLFYQQANFLHICACFLRKHITDCGLLHQKMGQASLCGKASVSRYSIIVLFIAKVWPVKPSVLIVKCFRYHLMHLRATLVPTTEDQEEIVVSESC